MEAVAPRDVEDHLLKAAVARGGRGSVVVIVVVIIIVVDVAADAAQLIGDGGLLDDARLGSLHPTLPPLH